MAVKSALVRRAILMIAAAVSSHGAASSLASDPLMTAQQLAAKIDGFLESHWSAHEVQPASRSDDPEFLRRATLDLLGRIPTRSELDSFLADTADQKRAATIARLIDGPEFPLHFGNVLDQMIQTRHAGDEAFVDYLRRSIRDSKSWDAMFREMMLGPWDTDALQPANRFLDKRAKATDVLAVDAARLFFGVDISCAKCHDHPLVDDWKQEHFYGMVAFFHRTTGGKGKVGEKKEGDVTFLASDGAERVAKVMFLSGQIVEEPAAAAGAGDEQKPHLGRREQLVNVAMEQQEFFNRAIVNRMWEHFFGRGLVDPIDQMHSGNKPAVPGLLEWLSADFGASGYDLRRLIAAVVNSRAYQLSSRWEHDSPMPQPELFAAFALRPLSKQQLAFSLLQATGNGDLSQPSDIQQRVERYAGVAGLRRIEQYLTMEKRAASLVGPLDPRRADFQSSVSEALFLSNNSATQDLFAGGAGNLAAELAEIKDNRAMAAEAVRAILSRPPNDDEVARLSEWLDGRDDDRRKASEQLIWALATSAEFRFNH